MKKYPLTILLFLFIIYQSHSQDKSLSDVLAYKYCKELSQIDTVTKANFEEVLPKIDETIVFSESGFLPLIVKEVKERKIYFEDFYTEVYNKFSRQCPVYQELYGMDTTIQLKDVAYFTDNYCECFNTETGGKIENNDLSSVLKTCNEKFQDDRTYKRKVRKELRNKELSRQEFSEYITAKFLTECDLIVDHFFSIQAKYLALNTELMLKREKP